MKTEVSDGWILFFEDDADMEDESGMIAQYRFEDRMLMNQWGTIQIQIRADGTNLIELVKKMHAFEMSILDHLA